jgi:c-di-GMP-binding flagellar brake protein YcgR
MTYEREDALDEGRVRTGVAPATKIQAMPQRQHPRTSSASRSSFDTWQTGFGAVRGISLDISQGGLGAIVEGNLRIGEAVQIDFALKKRKLTTVGIVRDASSERCGFQFLGLNEEERRQIITLADTA